MIEKRYLVYVTLQEGGLPPHTINYFEAAVVHCGKIVGASYTEEGNLWQVIIAGYFPASRASIAQCVTQGYMHLYIQSLMFDEDEVEVA